MRWRGGAGRGGAGWVGGNRSQGSRQGRFQGMRIVLEADSDCSSVDSQVRMGGEESPGSQRRLLGEGPLNSDLDRETSL